MTRSKPFDCLTPFSSLQRFIETNQPPRKASPEPAEVESEFTKVVVKMGAEEMSKSFTKGFNNAQ